ncbi:hypothetical protein, partial [Streptomyces glaucescens]|uniref:hypothetical protein n=1 Tax=Streptomyces glaucescens TaxID=1907 RepID=UPI001B80498B
PLTAPLTAPLTLAEHGLWQGEGCPRFQRRLPLAAGVTRSGDGGYQVRRARRPVGGTAREPAGGGGLERFAAGLKRFAAARSARRSCSTASAGRPPGRATRSPVWSPSSCGTV